MKPRSRRQFLKDMGILGGGLIVYFAVGDMALSAKMPRKGFLAAKIPTDFNAFLRIGADGRATLFTGKIEMGQGVVTALPQLLAEELDVACHHVDIVMGDTALCPWDAGTFGSLSIRHFGMYLREAAAEAKGVLKVLAAEQLGCAPEDLFTRNGIVSRIGHPGLSFSYGALTRGRIIERHLEALPPLKPASAFKVVGTSFPQRDAREKVTGHARYAADIRVPGMRYAKLLRPPAHGAVLKEMDASGAEQIPGVQVVRDGDLVAVLHAYPDVAEKALGKIAAAFTMPPATGLTDRTIYDHLVKEAPPLRVLSEAGSVAMGKQKAVHRVDAVYTNAYVAHAPMEPHAAVAWMEKGVMNVWASTQGPFAVQQEVAGALGLSPERVRVRTPYVGGGFGGKYPSQQAVEAARIAKLTGTPVQVAWSRAEEFFYDHFRPAAVVKVQSGVDAEGTAVLWDYEVYCAGEEGTEPFYWFPHHRIASSGGWMGPGTAVHPFAVGAWRAPAVNTNTFAREMQMSFMAAAAHIDPLAFRLNLTRDGRMVRVLEAAAEKFGWTPIISPSGRGRGVSCGIETGTYVAAIAEVTVDENTGRVTVDRLVCAQDMGTVVNPEGARMQMEGCLTMGLGYALSEEIHFQDGKIEDRNFDTYSLPGFQGLPHIETVLVHNPELPPQGGGEPAIINMGAVIASAVYDAVGVKMLHLPITPERILAALKKKNWKRIRRD